MVATLVMHEMHGGSALWNLNAVANLVIVAGYVLVPFTVLRELPLTVSVKLAGGLFFLTCAFTHLSMAFGWQLRTFMVGNHVVQAASVVWFVVGFWLLLRRANAHRRGDPPVVSRWGDGE